MGSRYGLYACPIPIPCHRCDIQYRTGTTIMTLHPHAMITRVQSFLRDYFGLVIILRFIQIYRAWYQLFLLPFATHSDYLAVSSALLSPMARADCSEIELDDIQHYVPPDLYQELTWCQICRQGWLRRLSLSRPCHYEIFYFVMNVV